MNTKEMEQKYELPAYPKRDVVIVKGKDAKLYDEEGKEYIDCAANMSVSNIGHGNEEVAKALHDQYSTLGSCYSIFYNDVRAKLAKKLVDISPKKLTRVFFTNSGAESVEAAIKFVRASGKKEIIAAMRGYHGKTMGALAATWSKDYQKHFMPMLEGFVHVPFNNFEKLENAITEDTGAVLLEIVQGESGARIGDKEYFKNVRKLCDEKGIFLIIDEVQTGFGRTGTMFASEQYVVPDIMCLAKSIAGGVPMGAVLCSDRVEIPLKSHSSTFGGNPLACAAALATIDVMEKKNLVKQSKELGAYLLEELRKIKSDKIREVRGLGLMVGIELKEKAGPYALKLMEKGIIVVLAGKTVIRLLPPLVISKEELDQVVSVLKELL